MKRRFRLSTAFVFACLLLALGGGSAAGGASELSLDSFPGLALSGTAELREVNLGIGITQCPQAGIKPQAQPRPLQSTPMDRVEQISNTGDDQRSNFEYSCGPQNEASIAVNPTNQRNIVGGANDYRLGWGTSGLYASTDNGNTWYGSIQPFPTLPNGDNLDGGGDPALVFDRDGIVYAAQINFNRTDDESGIFVSRSTNGGFTWSRPCVPVVRTVDGEEQIFCGFSPRSFPTADPRKPGDGVVVYNDDPDETLNFSVPFHDKEYIEAGPRPAGVEPVCFDPLTRAPVQCDPAVVGSDRVYVTWTAFAPGGRFGFTSKIFISYSDDQGRSWSPPEAISRSASFCDTFSTVPEECDLNQFSYPTAHPETGHLWVHYHNFNTRFNVQILVVRSRDGGQTWEGPFFVTNLSTANYPRAGITRPDCTARGQGRGRQVLTNSCFRVNSAGYIVVDRRSGAFADDLYIVASDNRNGTRENSNTDVFLFKSVDGGTTWVGPTRVNDDATTNDQWFPWIDISSRGDLNVVFHDRRLDTTSPVGVGEWPTSKTAVGNYLDWFFGAVCTVSRPDSRECVAPDATTLTPETGVPGPTTQTVFPFKNFSISDVPNNQDYSFRAGIFMGDYDNVVIGPEDEAWGHWTDSRNGRSSGGPGSPQLGRNPPCEQADVFVDNWSARSGGSIGQAGSQYNELFLVTPCPTDIKDPGAGGQ